MPTAIHIEMAQLRLEQILKVHEREVAAIPRRNVRISVGAAKAAAAAPLPVAPQAKYVREATLRIEILNGIGATTLRRWMQDDGFPLAHRVSDRILVWNVAEVEAWLASRPRTAGDGK